MNIPQLNILEDLFKELAPAYRRAWHELEQSQTATNRDSEAQAFITEIEAYASDFLRRNDIPVADSLATELPADNCWLVKAVCGRRNFARALSVPCGEFVFMRGGKPLVGVVYFPLANETVAMSHDGGMAGKRRGRMTQPKSLEGTIIHLPKGELHLAEKLIAAGATVRMNDNPASAFVDMVLGRVDAVVASELVIASKMLGKLFSQESGGISIDFGKTGLIACSHTLSDALTKALK